MPRKLSNTYGAIHQWVRRVWGQPSVCDQCGPGKGTRFEWALKSGKLSRIREDWMRLCSACHRAFDKTGKPSWNKGLKKLRLSLICEWCGFVFVPKRVNQIFCSRKCTGQRNGNIKKRLESKLIPSSEGAR